MTKKEVIRFDTGIRAVVRQTHPDMRVSKKFIDEVNVLLHKILKRLVGDAEIIKKNCKRSDLAAKDIQAAVRILFAPDLSKHAVSEGTKAVTISVSDERKGLSRTDRAKLVLSIPKVEAAMRSNLSKKTHIGQTAIIYLTAVLEYISAEVCEVSGYRAKEDKKSTVMDTHFVQAVNDDEDLVLLLKC